ncbi:MAG TPA: chorismate-binding protein [Pseudonocardiaceae bacterium]
MVVARFDDLTPGGRCFELSGLVDQFAAEGANDVAGVLRAAERAARAGRWVAGFVTYEAAPGLDPTLPAREWPRGHPLCTLPLAWFAACSDRTEVQPCRPAADPESVRWRLDRDRAWHRDAVAHVRESIARGDYYQLNLTARMTAEIRDAYDHYARLALAQNGAYNAFIATPEHTIMSASPELFFTRDGDEIVTRPMKGTAPRGQCPDDDLDRAVALRGSAKERAENIMIVDLLRNDLGRIATNGSVQVRELLATERYPTLWTLTSTIAARTRPNTDLAEIFGALFPSGSVTGAPKRAAMSAIGEIEQRPRGVYCGAIGYLAPHGVARFSVAIRTITRVRGTGYAEYGTGGGITYSSDAASEWAELLTKTAVLHHPSPTEGEDRGGRVHADIVDRDIAVAHRIQPGIVVAERPRVDHADFTD